MGFFMKKEKPRYEKPMLETLSAVGQGQTTPACVLGSFVDGSCSPQGAFATNTCSTGSMPGSA
jgi:hypothetical protein